MRIASRSILVLAASIVLLCGVAAHAQSEPALTLDPTTGPADTTVMADGSGFSAETCAVDLRWDTTDGTLLGRATASEGVFSIDFGVPSDATEGEHTVLAIGVGLDGETCGLATGEQAMATFTVETPVNPLTLDPATGPARSIVIVSGDTFETTSCGVELYLDSPSGTSLGSATLTEGAFSREIEIPGDAMEGELQIVAVGLDLADDSCSMMTGEEAVGTFAVVAADPGPFVSDPVTPFVQEMDLSDLPSADSWMAGDPVQVGPGETVDEDPVPDDGDGTDTMDARTLRASTLGTRERTRDGLPQLERMTRRGPMRQMLRAAMMSHEKGEPLINVDGIAATGVIPPSTGGDVGPDHFVQTVNAAFAIYDKQGNTLAGPSPLGALWTGTSSVCETDNDGDADVRYDPMADRWIISSIVAYDTQCLAVSRDADPVTGGWYLYEFPTGGVTNDYPRLAVWPGAYLVGTYRTYPTGGSDAWAFDREAMLGGKPAIAIRFSDPGWFMLPADLDGANPPAESAPAVFLRQVDGAQIGGDDRLELMELTANFADPTSSTLTGPMDLSTAPFDRDLCGYDLNTPCIEQPDGAPLLDSFTALALARLQYRVFDDHASLVFNHTVDADGSDHAGVRWYELRNSGAGWTVYQQGTHAPDGGEEGLSDDPQRWMASAAMDKNQNLALGYSVSGSDVYPGIRYGGRYAADALDTTPVEEQTLVNGSGAQTHPSGRWGEFSSMTVDPVDDCTFWYTAEYYGGTSEAGWSTRIGTFQLDDVPPEITCPTDAVAECSATGGTPADDEQLSEFFAGASATDDCTLEPEVSDDAPNFFMLGETEVTFTATDIETNSSDCMAQVTIEDTTMPDIVAPEDLEDVECTSPDGASPDLGMPMVEDICDAEPVVGNDAPPVFPIGTTTVTWSATDASGNVGMDTQSVEVVDTTPPDFEISADPAVLWPPNHKMIDIRIRLDVAEDVCDTDLDIELVSIESNEPPNSNGDGNTQPDFDSADFGTDDRHFRLRAERKGNGDGRVYTITYRATDDSGNATLATTTVTVPHDQGGRN